MESVQVTVLVPTKNEESVAELFIDWCEEGFRRANVIGEIIFADNSTDSTPSIAARRGVRVLRITNPGVGRAYFESVEFVNGEMVILGDVDCTYDFREIQLFLEKINSGYDFVLGSRFQGKIERGSMPLHHRFFGTPITTLIFNITHGTRYTDIHSGMRAMTKENFRKLIPRETGWQYASEMLARVRHLGLYSTEIPINFFKAPNARESHLKRGGWWLPFREGIKTVVTTSLNAADRTFTISGRITALIGMLLIVLSSIDAGSHDLHLPFILEIIGMVLCGMGFTGIFLGSLFGFIYRSYTGWSNQIVEGKVFRTLFTTFPLVLLSAGIFGIFVLSSLLNPGIISSKDIDFFLKFLIYAVLINFFILARVLLSCMKFYWVEIRGRVIEK
jgi:glycosyltransferase involved in cell wall biosynthesis